MQNSTIHYWIEQGADRKKLVLGMPMYGQSFSLAENTENGLNAPTYGGGEAGEETRARGFLSYYEVSRHINQLKVFKLNSSLIRSAPISTTKVGR